MTTKPVNRIDGRYLYYTFLAGGRKILQYQTEINSINVFPVNDKDTGTNLASTVRAVIDNIKPNKSFTITAGNIAEAALIGARGNSGVIFAQFLNGVSIETHDKISISLTEFAEIIKKSVKYIYEAVAEPVEGTMLTVIKDWAEYIYSKKEAANDFKQVVIDSFEIIKNSLLETKQKLKILRQSNVVDAGAKGFVVFIEGIIDFILNRDIRVLLADTIQTISVVHSDDFTHQNIKYRFCTEALIKDYKLDNLTTQLILHRYGDSAVVAGNEKNTRIHIHTNSPAALFHELKNFGKITSQKVDDMVRQNEVVMNRKWKIALVTDSTCDLSQELLDFYQIHVVPININFGESHYLDKVTITPNQFYDLLDTSPDFPKTSQINERTFTNLYSHLASHYDAVLAIHLTGQFSGTMLCSQKAAEKISKEFNKPVVVIDSKNLSGALGLLVLRAAQEIEKGVPLDELKNSVEHWIQQTKIFVSVKNLKYMVRGGRVSKQRGFIADLLNIKPIVSMDENGKSLLIGKAFSQKANMKKVINLIRKMVLNQNIWNYIVLHAHNEKGAQEYALKLEKLSGKKPVSIVNISPVIGMNAGIGTTAVSFMLE